MENMDSLHPIADSVSTSLQGAHSVNVMLTQVDTAIKSNPPLAELCGLFIELQSVLEEFKEAQTNINKKIQELSVFKIPEKLEELGLDKIQVPALKRSFYPVTRYSSSMKDKDLAFEWLREQGLEALIKETVNSNSLTTYLKSRLLEEGLEPPEDLFKFSSFTYTGSSKYTPKEGGMNNE